MERFSEDISHGMNEWLVEENERLRARIAELEEAQVFTDLPPDKYCQLVMDLKAENERMRQLLQDVYDNCDHEDDEIFNFKGWLEAVATELGIHEGGNSEE